MMLSPQPVIRRKAVWAPQLTLVGALLFFIGFAPNAIAAGAHRRSVPRAKPGVPRDSAKSDKLDKELTSRSKRNPSQTTRVIVTLQPGAELPAEFSRFARRSGKLRIINGNIVD